MKKIILGVVILLIVALVVLIGLRQYIMKSIMENFEFIMWPIFRG